MNVTTPHSASWRADHPGCRCLSSNPPSLERLAHFRRGRIAESGVMPRMFPFSQIIVVVDKGLWISADMDSFSGMFARAHPAAAKSLSHAIAARAASPRRQRRGLATASPGVLAECPVKHMVKPGSPRPNVLRMSSATRLAPSIGPPARACDDVIMPLILADLLTFALRDITDRHGGDLPRLGPWINVFASNPSPTDRQARQ